MCLRHNEFWIYYYSQNQNFEEKMWIWPIRLRHAIIFIDESGFNHYSINNGKIDSP